jgi:hypothetical protein
MKVLSSGKTYRNGRVDVDKEADGVHQVVVVVSHHALQLCQVEMSPDEARGLGELLIWAAVDLGRGAE